MSVIIWNFGGFGNQFAQSYLKSMISKHNPFLLGILEPKQPSSKIVDYANKIDFPYYSQGFLTNTHIWLFWTREIKVMIIEVMGQQIAAELGGEQHIRFSFIYAKCSRAER